MSFLSLEAALWNRLFIADRPDCKWHSVQQARCASTAKHAKLIWSSMSATICTTENVLRKINMVDYNESLNSKLKWTLLQANKTSFLFIYFIFLFNFKKICIKKQKTINRTSHGQFLQYSFYFCFVLLCHCCSNDQLPTEMIKVSAFPILSWKRLLNWIRYRLGTL